MPILVFDTCSEASVSLICFANNLDTAAFGVSNTRKVLSGTQQREVLMRRNSGK